MSQVHSGILNANGQPRKAKLIVAIAATLAIIGLVTLATLRGTKDSAPDAAATQRSASATAANQASQRSQAENVGSGQATNSELPGYRLKTLETERGKYAVSLDQIENIQVESANQDERTQHINRWLNLIHDKWVRQLKLLDECEGAYSTSLYGLSDDLATAKQDS
jgi:hypothetical protein